MKISDFESHIPDLILERGHRLYEGLLLETIEQYNGRWTALLNGTETYRVTATISNEGVIEEIDCTCPYDRGPHCKHQAAFLFQFRESGESLFRFPEEGELCKTMQRLEKMTKPDLLDFIGDQLFQHPHWQQEVAKALGIRAV